MFIIIIFFIIIYYKGVDKRDWGLFRAKWYVGTCISDISDIYNSMVRARTILELWVRSRTILEH